VGAGNRGDTRAAPSTMQTIGGRERPTRDGCAAASGVWSGCDGGEVLRAHSDVGLRGGLGLGLGSGLGFWVGLEAGLFFTGGFVDRWTGLLVRSGQVATDEVYMVLPSLAQVLRYC
jgi:hypothetical protein